MKLRYGLQAMRWRNRRFWLLLLEYLSSVTWCYSMLLLALIWLMEPNLSGLAVGHLFQWTGVMMTAICLLQFGVSIFIDHHYDKSMARSFIWCVWYPLIYWLLNLVTVVVAVPKAILRRRGQLAVWESPDRGESFRDKT